MSFRRFVYTIIFFIPVISFGDVSFITAQISPGELAHSHAHLEGITNCTNCHELGQKISSQKCLDCHVLIQSRLSQNKGYHASKAVRNKTCIECHKDHLGRDFQMVEWENGKDKFNHDLAGYVLEGKHKGIKCESCHKPSRITDQSVIQRKRDGLKLESTFLGVSRECGNCHFDEHRAQLGKDCYACHDFNDWKKSSEAKFDHSGTRFPLLGKHSLVSCVQCHPLIKEPKKKEDGNLDADYKNFKITKFDRCTYCHKDPHEGKFGLNCQKCHTPGGWLNVTISGFDHSKTNYPLTGKHLNVNCLKCHQPDSGKKAVYKGLKHKQCKDCHADEHHGQFASRKDTGACESCHTTSGFIPSSYTVSLHNEQSRFKLEGSHRSVACNSCHVKVSGNAFRAYSGLNADPVKATAVFTFKKQQCGDCHDDVHQGQFNGRPGGCEACHRPAAWDSLIFNHDTQTDFPLRGRHKETACVQCHKHVAGKSGTAYIMYKGVSRLCEDCHTDYHYGQFAVNDASGEHKNIHCERCHTENGFKPSVFDHNKQSVFPLSGKHEKADCSSCHSTVMLNNRDSTILYKPIRTTCSSCHADL